MKESPQKPPNLTLVKVEHERCQEIQCHTLVWAPKTLTKKAIAAAIDRAKESYLKNLAALASATPPNDYTPYGGPPFSIYPTMTVQEIEKEWNKKKQVWEAWDKLRREQQDSFSTYLKREGFYYFFEYNPPKTFTVFWGHRHGESIDYGETTLKDFPGPRKVVENEEEI